jgi:hypothetical protein
VQLVSDIILDDSEQVTVLCTNLNVQGHDLLLDSSARRKSNAPPFRRAMVHDQNDGLTINFNSDYPGGVTLNGVTEVRPQRQAGVLGALVAPNLVIRGGITYEVQGVDLGGGATTVTVSVEEELSKLRTQLADLAAKLAALEASA